MRGLSKILAAILVVVVSCKEKKTSSEINAKTEKQVTASDILGNPEYQAISYGGYRHKDTSFNARCCSNY